MNAWLLACLALLPGAAAAVLFACRGRTANRFIALQLAISFTILILTAMTFAFDQSSFIDLPLALAFLNLPGAVLIGLFLERWL